VRGAAGRQWQRRDGEQDDEEDREALLPEQLDQARDGLLAVAGKPALELVADRRRRLGRLVCGGQRSTGATRRENPSRSPAAQVARAR
jgi:hypothetical protein